MNKPKIAFFSPFRPIKSGISDYCHELLPFLAPYFEPDLYFDEGYAPDNTNLNHNLFPWGQFEQRVINEEYDHTIYQMGNSSYHCYAYYQLTKYPGIAVLHDYYLGGLIKGLNYQYPEFGITLLEELQHSYGKNKTAKILGLMERGELDTCAKLASAEIYLNRRVFTSSLGVIVHSNWAYKQAIKDFSHENQNIVHIPMLMPQFKPQESSTKVRYQLGICQDKFIISVFGLLTHAKRAIPILQSFSKYIVSYPNSLLVYVGDSTPIHELLMQEIKKIGLVNKVKVIGYVAMSDFYKYIHISDLCLNLRYPSTGESSASLMRILSASKPVIVTDIGSFTDFPDDVVFKIPQPTQCNEVEEIFRALVLLTENKRYRQDLGLNASKYITRKHSPEQCARLYAEFMEKVLYSPKAQHKLLTEYVKRQIASLVSYDLLSNQSSVEHLQQTAESIVLEVNRWNKWQCNREKKWLENKVKAWKKTAKNFKLN